MAPCRSDKPASPGGCCPICLAPTNHAVRPFCSRRCADLDLSRWLRGGYAIPVLADEDEDGDDAAAAANGAHDGVGFGGDDDAAGRPRECDDVDRWRQIKKRR